MIYGTVDVSVYSKLLPQQIQHLDIPPIFRDKTQLIENGFLFPSEKTLLKSVTPEHETLVLTPGMLFLKPSFKVQTSLPCLK